VWKLLDTPLYVVSAGSKVNVETNIQWG